MTKQRAIILGIGGNNSNAFVGTFYEGVMTSGDRLTRGRNPSKPTSWLRDTRRTSSLHRTTSS